MNRIWLVPVALAAALTVGCAPTGTEPKSEAARQADQESVRSADGTRIGFAKIGTGPAAVVIVPGVLDRAEQWVPAATAMAGQCTCYVMDRRGRGRSGDGANYTFDREIEDIKAVLDAAGAGAYLLGHSSGAIYALEAARRFPVAGLVLYEPPLHYQGRFETILAHIRVEAQAQRFDNAVAVFLKEEAGMPDDQISAARAAPYWHDTVALVPTLVREWDEIVRVGPTVERYRNVSVPTLLLSGRETASHPTFATKELEGTLPNVRKVMLEGQGHEANLTAPDLVAKEVSNFLLSTRR